VLRIEAGDDLTTAILLRSRRIDPGSSKRLRRGYGDLPLPTPLKGEILSSKTPSSEGRLTSGQNNKPKGETQ
jgi:hypothetical protein